MKKVNSFFKILFIIFLFVPSQLFGLEYPSVKSEHVVIYDLTDNRVMYSLNGEDKASVASLTKIMTTIVAIEKIEDLSSEVTITWSMLSTVPWDASVAGLEAGDTLTYEDLLYASMLPSGADATNSLAILLSGSISDYVDEMNEKASELGMDDTHFVNVTGLDDSEHYSTANDIVKLLKYAMKNEVFKEIFTTQNYTLSNGLRVKSSLNYYNSDMNLDVSNILGSKTGFTDDAGYCIGVYFKASDHDIIAITLNAPRRDGKFYNLVDAVDLVDFTMNSYGYNVVLSKEDVIEEVPVMYSNIDSYSVKVLSDIEVFIENEFDKNLLEVKYEGKNELDYKNELNEKLGTIKIYYDDVLYGEEDVYLNADINMNVFKIIWKYKYYILGGVVLLVFLRVCFRKKKRKSSKKAIMK